MASCANPVSAAKLLLHLPLAPPRPSPHALAPAPVLDFLLPPRSTSTTKRRLSLAPAAAAAPPPRPVLGARSAGRPTPATAAVAARARSSGNFETTTRPPTTRAAAGAGTSTMMALGSQMSPARAALSRRIRQLATTPSYHTARRYTQALYNPQKDEDGNEMKLEITPRAAKALVALLVTLPPRQDREALTNASPVLPPPPSQQRLSEIMSKDSNPHLALRIQVESGGCHGFQYLMSLVTLPSTLPVQPAEAAHPSEHPGEGADSGVIREDDTIFTYTKEEGEAPADPAAAAPKILLDQPSLELLKGSKVDYTMELIGSQFKIVDNPMATSSCGCGTSFDLKSL